MANLAPNGPRHSDGEDNDVSRIDFASQEHAMTEAAAKAEASEGSSPEIQDATQNDDAGLSGHPDSADDHEGGTANGVNGTASSNQRGQTGDDQAYLQRPLGPTRTPSSTYNPSTSRRPRPPQTSSTYDGTVRSSSATRPWPSDSRFRAQERAYVQKLRQENDGEYFNQYDDIGNDSDSDGETPSTESPFDDRLDQETIMFYGDDTVQPTDDELKDPESRERLEWHGMLEAVLTGDVVRQEKKRLIGSSEQAVGKTGHKTELWLGVRSKVCGRHLPVQKRIVEEGRAVLDRTLDEIINFKVKGESEAGKNPYEQVCDIVASMEKCESLYPSWAALIAEHPTAASPHFSEAYESIMSWYNTNTLINTELLILKKWVGNDELDFSRTKQRSPAVDGIAPDEASFLDRLLKEDGLKSLLDDKIPDNPKGMLPPIGNIISKAKVTFIRNSAPFQKRHLPPYLDELLTLISFPSRLIEEITRMRLAYARRVKETAQQNPLMQDQMIKQFQLLLKAAIRIKGEYLTIEKPEPGWDLPPCIDESFDHVVLEALKYYFKMLNWKLTGNRNTFKEAELLFQDWEFANDIGRQLQRGHIEVAEQFSSLALKSISRLSQTFEKELQGKSGESAADMTKRYKACLDSVRVRQRMLQRFSRMLSDNYEHASDYSISYAPQNVSKFFDQLAATGHFRLQTGVFEDDGIYIIASHDLKNRLDDIQAMMAITKKDTFEEESSAGYILVARPEETLSWFGTVVDVSLRSQVIDLKRGQLRLCATSSQALPNARKEFLDAVDMHVDLLQEARSNIHKVNQKLTDIRKVTYKLSNTFMDSVETIRRQALGTGRDCHELIQTCFVFATEFGQRSLLYMDSNRRQMNNLKLTKLALDWVSFICDDCVASDRKTFRWAVQALELAMGMTRGRHVLALGENEYSTLRIKVAGCMSVLISHFDIMGARSNLAAQAERERVEAMMGQFRKLDSKKMLDDEEAARCRALQRIELLDQVDGLRLEKDAERRSLGRVLEANNEADRSLAYLSSSAMNVTMRWQQGAFVGGGTFGNVYVAMNLESGQLMAVKEIRLQDPKQIPTIAEQIRDEMGVLEVLDHPNVVAYHGIEVHRDRVYIFMEYCSGGSLAALLKHGRIEDEQVITVYALQLLEGLVYLHESRITHRDIKPENILLDHNGIIKYVDFGAAKVIARQGRTLVQDLHATKRNKSMTGTPMYMSPEVIKGELSENSGRAGAVDIWSLGCVILEMATGRRPWANLDNEWSIMYNIGQGHAPALPTREFLSAQGLDFVKKCFIRDPSKRWTAVELLQHEWIMAIRSQVVESPTPSEMSSSAATTPYSNYQ
ncbi:MAP kinase kinase kinase SskB, putative [Cordyceps militaris CM01]|uniref:MAP kinase kinase kinase n=2 Tax=Cordyceps militaris TaxID=73501 RepID=G3J8Z3_CORMM|nr:MAP kinase kinase kinase SskB, putative [Cordyceps militaris CM01]ATY60018.1 MAP kinase kinase kinase [Cordyceps militaris]EGX94025.1 MAP kinase kinase kinase SskB, putative [Cordyceps militaris CM01]